MNIDRVAVGIGLALLAGLAWWNEARTHGRAPAGPGQATARAWLAWISLVLLALYGGWWLGLWAAGLNAPVTITRPQPGATVSARVQVEGEAHRLPAGQSLWAWAQPVHGGSWTLPHQPLLIQPGGHWAGVVFVGSEGDQGQPYTIVVASSPAQALGASPSPAALSQMVVLAEVAVQRR